MKMESKIILMNTLINSGIMAAAIIAVVLVTRGLINKSRNKEEIEVLNNLNIDKA